MIGGCMDIKKAAVETKKALVKSSWLKGKVHGEGDADTYDHIVWMLIGIEQGYIQGEMAHRWLGWAQCAIYIYQNVPLEKLKQINHLA
jgi:hypothetical protein